MEVKFQKVVCDELNKVLADNKEDYVLIINNIIDKKVFQNGGSLYWDRELFIDCGADDNKCRRMIRTNPDDVMFRPTFDSIEHPGITLTYKTKNDKQYDNN